MLIRLRTLAIAVAVVAVLGAGGIALFVLRGVYDISAMNQHTGLLFKVMDFALRRAIQARASEQPPADIAESRRVLAGATRYRDHCSQCHGAPGIPPDPFAFGLRPAPANLLHAGRTWDAAEVFWVVKNGIKMTGMPSWSYRLSDDEIWDLVAFVQAMPQLAPAQYADMTGARFPASTRALLDGPAAAGEPHAGDVQAGRRAASQYLCATCHVIPGFVSAGNHVGPPLSGIAGRAFIAGVLPNTRDNMVRWLKNPQDVDPLSAMPPLGLSDQDARDIAAFLATLDKVHK